MTRVLYVAGGGVASVEKDGESLLVKVEGEADRRYPFRLLSSVVLFGDTRIHAAALWGLMDAGVPVSLLSRNGQPSGFLMPYRINQSTLAECVDAVLERPDCRDTWKNWLVSNERHEMWRLANARGWRIRDWRTNAVEDLLKIESPHAYCAACTLWHSMVVLELMKAWAEAGLGAHQMARLEKELGLIRDISRLLLWEWKFSRMPTQVTPDGKAEWNAGEQQERARIRHWVGKTVEWLRRTAWQGMSGTRGW